MAGLIKGLTKCCALARKVVGVSVINAPGVIAGAVSPWLHEDVESCRIVLWTIDDCHFGGYARARPELSDFFAQYSGLNDIPLEPVYSSRLSWRLNLELQSEQIQEGAGVTLIHSGGVFLIAILSS